MSTLLKNSGFEVEECDYMTDAGTVDVYAVAQKPY